MFLDPDPKQRNSGSGFFASQRPVVSPRDSNAAWRRRNAPLSERTPSENNQQNPGTSTPIRSTVRLVKPLPEPPAGIYEEDGGDGSSEEENRPDAQNIEHWSSSSPTAIEASVLKPGSSGSTNSRQGYRVSDTDTPTNRTQDLSNSGRDNLLSTTSGYVVPRTEICRHGSSGSYSDASTFKDQESSYGQKSLRTESRVSEGSTLRSTPTPSEQEHRERIIADAVSRAASVRTLDTLEETSPERSTVRIVPTPVKSDSNELYLSSEPSNSPLARPRTSPSDSEREATISQRSSRRTSSAGSLPRLPYQRTSPASPTPRYQSSEESIALSEATIGLISSPNVIAFYSDSSRPRSQSQPLRGAHSIESTQSRLQYPSIHRPDTGRSVATSSLWASRPPSADTLQPLDLPKKRLRHKAASSSLSAEAGAANSSQSKMDAEDVDTLPYPRQAFSSHLSTIASESDPQSRSVSQHLSHFSIGSGVLTGDDSSSLPLSPIWPGREGESVQAESIVTEISPLAQTVSSGSEPGDMTMGVYREESAMPPPLFKMRSPSVPLPDKKYGGTLPPLPSIPNSRHSDEDFDTVPELRPALREQRSGYSLRRRSHSTPSYTHSRQVSQASEFSRSSEATSIFPTWAKHYYVYGATLLSSSQISLSDPVYPDRIPNSRQYVFNRDWSEPSTNSRLGTGYSEFGGASPASSRFLPSIFRPRAKRDKSGSPRRWMSKRSKPSPRLDEGRSDSMVIASDPERDGESSVLPSGQPKYGSLKDDSDQPRPLPRTYSKQKKWDEMEFPRPMSKDHLTGYGMTPHLAPTKRTSNRMNKWRPPSFADSLDTLIRSRCNRQILLFVLGFLCPLFWMLASVLPLPKKPMTADEFKKTRAMASENDLQAAMAKHEAGDSEKRFAEEKLWLKARWWRYLNRVMSFIGVLVIAAVIALAVVATTK